MNDKGMEQQDPASRGSGDAASGARPRITRRQALTRISTGAAAGAAVWVMPEILTAKPAAGAMTSGSPGGNTGSAGGPPSGNGSPDGQGANPSTTGSASPGVSTLAATPVMPASSAGGTGVTTSAATSGGASTSPATLAATGLDIRREVELGAAMVAGGWAMHRWASRMPKKAVAADGSAHEAGSAGTPA